MRWLSTNSVKRGALQDAALDTLSLRTTDGKQAAANTIARKRAVFYGSLRYAVELRLLLAHPMDHVQWVTPKAGDEVDRRSVVNPWQAIALLAAAGGVLRLSLLRRPAARRGKIRRPRDGQPLGFVVAPWSRRARSSGPE